MQVNSRNTQRLTHIIARHASATNFPLTPAQAPDVYLEALRRLGAASPRSAARALVIEDAAHGLAAARAAGAYAVAVTTSLPAEALAPHADEVVGGLRDLVGRLAALRPGGTAADRPRAAAGVEAAKGVAAGAEAEAAGAVS
jgi:phosphoglycolate phosphatase-like HAD superfamily hydrolase